MEVLSKRQNVTVLFTIVRDFSRIVNILTLEENHAFLNDCAQIITDNASKYHGSLTNSIGHRIQTVFADPTAEFENAQRAVKCASSIQNAVQEPGKAPVFIL